MFIKKSILTTIIFSLCVLPSFGQKGKGLKAVKNISTHTSRRTRPTLRVPTAPLVPQEHVSASSLQNHVQRTIAATQLNHNAVQGHIALTRQAVISMGEIGHSVDVALKKGYWSIAGAAEEAERATEPVINTLSRERIITFIRTSMQEADPAQRLQLTDNLLEIENGNFKRMVFAGVGEYPEVLEQFLPNYPEDTEEIVKEVLLYGFFNETTLPILLRDMSVKERTNIVIDMLRREKFDRPTALLPYDIDLEQISTDLSRWPYRYGYPTAAGKWIDRARATKRASKKKKF